MRGSRKCLSTVLWWRLLGIDGKASPLTFPAVCPFVLSSVCAWWEREKNIYICILEKIWSAHSSDLTETAQKKIIILLVSMKYCIIRAEDKNLPIMESVKLDHIKNEKKKEVKNVIFFKPGRFLRTSSFQNTPQD